MLRAIRVTSILAAVLAAIPAYAEVYKWVDEHGVTNYSSEPPAARNRGPKPATVADRISVYAPEPGVQRTLSAISLGREKMLADRIDLLERQHAAERQSSQYAAAAEARAAQAAYAQCVAERRVDCDYDSSYYPYGLGGVLTVIQRRPRHHIPAMTRPRLATQNSARFHAGGKFRRPSDLPR